MAASGYKLFVTGDVLTAAQVNDYLMLQTVMVFASSAARTTALSGVLAEGLTSYLKDTNSFEIYDGSGWVSYGSGDITAVSAGTGISVASGTGPVPVVTNSMATEITAKGDLIAGTGSATFDNLPVGTNGQTLVADSTASTGLKWATATSGGMTLISTTTLSGASVTLSSIPQTYTHLQIYVAFVKNDTANGSFRISPNGGTNYVYAVKNYNGTASGEAAAYISPSDSYDRTNDTNFQHYNIYNYATDTGWKTYDGAGGFFNAGGYRPFQNGGYIYTAGAALSSLVISNSGGNLSAGTIYLYGVK